MRRKHVLVLRIVAYDDRSTRDVYERIADDLDALASTDVDSVAVRYVDWGRWRKTYRVDEEAPDAR